MEQTTATPKPGEECNDRVLIPTPQANVEITPDAEKQEITIGIDVDKDGKPDFEFKAVIKDPRLWAGIAAVLGIAAILKGLGFW